MRKNYQKNLYSFVGYNTTIRMDVWGLIPNGICI